MGKATAHKKANDKNKNNGQIIILIDHKPFNKKKKKTKLQEIKTFCTHTDMNTIKTI